MELTGTLSTWFLVGLVYSFIGWIGEVVVLSTIKKRLVVSRGFLVGPLCPIYGVGALLMTLLLRNVDNIFIVFIVAVISSGVLEYFTSFAMEKLFRVRWWDYGEEAFNLHGRICLKNLFYFGIGGIFLVYIGNPFLFSVFENIPIVTRVTIAGVLLFLLLVDIGVSLWLVIVCRVTVGTVEIDATEEISQRVREILAGKGKLKGRLVRAFPNMEAKKKAPRARKTQQKRC